MKKGLATLCLLFFVCIFVMSCNTEKKQLPENTPGVTQDNTKETQTISIYTIDAEELDLMPLQVAVDKKKLKASDIVSLVLENLEEEVKVKNVIEKGNAVTVIFKKGSIPMKGTSAKMEMLILNCIGNSLLDNLDTCDEVLYQTEEGAYESGHISLEIDEPYVMK